LAQNVINYTLKENKISTFSLGVNRKAFNRSN